MISKSSSAVLAFLASSAFAYTASSDSGVCNLVTETYSGQGIWMPDPTAWGQWDSSKSTTSSQTPAASTATWSEWDSSKSSSTAKASSSSSSVSWTSSASATTSKSATSTSSQWSEWSVSSSSTSSSSASKSSSVSSSTTKATPSASTSSTTTVFRTTSASTTASTTSSTKATTTTAAPSASATCPSDNGLSLAAGGSCGCDFQINCDVRGDTSSNPNFWDGSSTDTLAECNARCDNNSDCQATLWVDDSTSSDYHECWQISGSFPVAGSGYAQISYKGTCSGTCSSSYNS